MELDGSALILLLVGLNIILLVWILSVQLRRKQVTDQTAGLETTLQSIKSDILERQMEGLVSLRESLDSANRLLNERLSDGNLALDRRMELFTNIENKLGQLETQTKNIESVGKNIQSLSDLLKPPKLRGGLGELLLENLLSQILPPALFDTQYSLAAGQRVDAVIKLADRLLPIDSKFPLEAFQRLSDDPESATAHKEFLQAFRKHVDAIADKYIRPDEGTADFAIMYIPSEAVYYRFVADDTSGLEYALKRRVVPSSPGHLYAFLASLAAVYAQAGLTGESRHLIAGLDSLATSLERLTGYQQRLEGSTRSLTNALNRSRDELQTMAARLKKLREPIVPEPTTVADSDA